MSRGMKVRLPLLLAVAVGLALWRSSLFTQTRELVLLLPPTRASAARVEVQLYSEAGELLKREERFFNDPGGTTGALVLRFELSLRAGRYLCRAFVRDTAGAELALSRTVDIGDGRTYEVELSPNR